MAGSRLKGKAALVTGTAQGIGKALALKLASEGAAVYAIDLDGEKLASLAADIETAGGECQTLAGDITEQDFGDRAVEGCLAAFGDLHIVVNNAGYIWNSRIVNHTDEQWYAMMDVHATGPFRLLRAAGKHFRQMARDGRTEVTRKVVNVSSVSGLYGAETQFSYSAAKSALIGMTRSLARDWGRYNVTVNCVAFGYVETRLTQGFENEIPEIDVGGRRHKVGIPEAALTAIEQSIPLRRRGTPEDGAGAIFLFCLPESDYITGEIIVASGGARG